MKTLYLECHMGAAGDMLTAALYELLIPEQRTAFEEKMNSLYENVSVHPVQAMTNGIVGTRMEVRIGGVEEKAGDSVSCGTGDMHAHEHSHTGEDHDHEAGRMEEGHGHGHSHAGDAHDHGHRHDHGGHGHTTPAGVSRTIAQADLPEDVKRHAQAVYDSIAEAESHAHGKSVTQIHFHEVGNMDAIADVTGVCLAVSMLQPDRIVASPVHLGSGSVRCAHGVMPVPAPATAYLMQGIPCYTGEIQGELCTPTGAALLKHFAESFGPMPMMMPEKIGNGVGTKEFPTANCVRAFFGEEMQGTQAAVLRRDAGRVSDINGLQHQVQASSCSDSADDICRDVVIELCCHIDDMTAEELAFAGERLMEAGALDVSFAPVTMKKGRPGTVFTVLGRPKDEKRLAERILSETTSNGVRVRRCERYLLEPSVSPVETEYGQVRMKSVKVCGTCRRKPEYEDLAGIAREKNATLRQVREAAEAASFHGPADV